MRASRLAFSASLFFLLLPLSAHANFEMSGSAPTSTLPAFQANATYSASGAEVQANPANYYAATGAPVNLQPSYAQPQPYGNVSYAMTPLQPQAQPGGYDPGVGPAPVVIEGNAQNTQNPVIIEGKPRLQTVGYGYATAAPDASQPPSPYDASAAMSAQGYNATPATAAYNTGTPAYVPQGNAPAAQNYGAGYGVPYGASATPPTYGANSYGMSGYAPSYGAQAGYNTGGTAPGMLGQMQQPQGYGGGYAAPQPTYGSSYGAAPQTYAPPGYAATTQQAYNGYGASPYSGNSNTSGGTAGDQAAYASPVPYSQTTQSVTTAVPAYGNGAPTTTYGSSTYNSPGYAAPQPMPAYGAPPPQGYGAGGYGGGYGGGYPPAPQPAYGYGNYPPAPQPAPDYGSQNYGGAAGYQPMNYEAPASSRRSRYDSGAASLGAEPAFGRGGLYVALRTALLLPQNTKFTDTTGAFDTDYNTGFEFGGALGYTFAPFGRWFTPRLEAEVSHTHATVNAHTITSGSPATTTKIEDPNAFGNTDSWRFFGNAYLDFDTPWRGWFTPYIGGGAGMGIVDYDRHGTTPSGVNISDSDSGFAYNVGGGLSFPLFARGTSFDVGYRYSQILGLNLDAQDGTRSKTDVGNHEITLGLRQRF